MADHRKALLVELTADITASYVEHNTVAVSDLPALIQSIHTSLRYVDGPSAPEPEPPPAPAVPIRRSVTDDYLICLEDGKPFKSLKRHLWTKYRLTPQDYRARWGLPKDYPMVAPGYAAARSSLARQMGLGRGGRTATQEDAAANTTPETTPTD